ncbi:MAG TPA: Rrf2 family transcriptional regulator [Ilumatobacter sp.]|nr:Rrf2 family transcriptional regulator [Ilumatobacter sp.]
MKISETVEWGVHCCTLLASLSDGQTLPAAKLAEFHEVPPAYLAKALQALSVAGIAESRSGPRGGYRLARPTEAIRLLDIVLAIDGHEAAFRCSEIRQRGPAGQPGSPAPRKPCGIASAMWRAEDAWRAELAAVTVADLVAELLTTVPSKQLVAGWEWIQQVQLRPRANTATTETEHS